MLFNLLQDYGGGDIGWTDRDLAGSIAGGAAAASPLLRRPTLLSPEELAAMQRADARAPASRPDDPLTLDSLLNREADRARQTFPGLLPSAYPQDGPSLVPDRPQPGLLDQVGLATAGLFGIPRSREEAGLPPAGSPPSQAPPALTREQLGLTPPLDQFNNARQSPEIPASQPLTREAFGLVPEQAPAPREVGPGSARGGGLSFAGQAKGGPGDAAPKAGDQPPPLPMPAPPVDPAAQKGTWDQFDRYMPSPLERRLADMTGVAYGQMPLHFDPAFRQRAIAGLQADSEFGQRRQLLELQGQQEMARVQAQLAAQERMGSAENANRLAVAEMSHRPNLSSLKADALLKLAAGSMQADPTGQSLTRTVEEFNRVAWPLIEGPLHAQAQGPQLAAERPGYGGQLPTAGPPPAAGAPTDRDLVMRMMNDMRNVAAKTTQTPEGATQYEFNREAAEQAIPRLAQMYSQYNLSPAQKAEFLRQFSMGQRGGMGDPGAIREAAAIQAARAYLQSHNFGEDFYDPKTGYPQSLTIPNPADPTAAPLSLGVAPKGRLARTMSDVFEAAATNPLSFIDPDQPGPIPWETLSVPSRGIVDFPRGSVVPSLGRRGAGERAKRDADALIRFYFDIAANPPR